MRRMCLAVTVPVIVLLASSTVGAASSSHKASPKCPPRGAEPTWLANEQAVVYALPERVTHRDPNEPEVLPVEFFGCAYGHSRIFDLGQPSFSSSSGCGGVEPEALAGTTVAYEVNCPREMKVRDLVNGRVLRRLRIGPGPGVRTELGYAETVVVKANGSVAWIEDDTGSELRTTEYTVEAIDSSGRRVLAAGTDIAPHSLARAGDTLYWTQGGKPMSASLH